MRDIIVFLPVLIGALAALRHPWIGVLLWTWLSIMNPHRYTWGFAHDAPLAAMAAVCTLIGLLATAEKRMPLSHAPARWLLLFMVWISLSWLAGLDPDGDYAQWNKVMKIDLMILVAMAVMISKQHIFALVWVVAGSLALLGAKGGVFTILTGGSYRVWGPPDSYIEGNNEFALALAITIPLLRFLQLQLQSPRGRHLMTVVMVLCAAAALGSHSRGGLLAVSAMALMMWWRGRNRLQGGIVIVIAAVALVAFMPDEWSERMNTIETFQEDRSAMGRISAWWTAWNLAFQYPFGVGFNAAREALFVAFSPYGLEYGTPVAHSIYFQVLGHHGFIGLAIFLGIWIVSYRWAGWLRTEAAKIPQAQWAADLGAMCQVSLVGYAVGGAFLSLAYFDLPYNLLVLVVLSRAWVEQKRWQLEPEPDKRWWRRVPGLNRPAETGGAALGAGKARWQQGS